MQRSSAPPEQLRSSFKPSLLRYTKHTTVKLAMYLIPLRKSAWRKRSMRCYFSLRQLIEARFSTVLDSIWMSKPLRSRYFSIITWPVPSRDTP